MTLCICPATSSEMRIWAMHSSTWWTLRLDGPESAGGSQNLTNHWRSVEIRLALNPDSSCMCHASTVNICLSAFHEVESISPICFGAFTCCGCGCFWYFLVEAVQSLWKTFDGFSGWSLPSSKTCQVKWSGPLQGCLALLEE